MRHWGGALVIVLALGCGTGTPLDEATLRTQVSTLAAATDTVALADLAQRQCGALEDEARQTCYEDYFVALAGGDRIGVALGALSVLAGREKKVEADGHGYTHVIGITSWRPGMNLGTTFRSCTGLFQSGCYHGVIQAYFTGEGNVDSTKVSWVCDLIQGNQTDWWLRFQCVHGIGHGLEMVWNWDLPKALAGCDWLESDWDRQGCYGGAFMENAMASMPGGHHTPARAIAAVQGTAADGGGDPTDEHAGHGMGAAPEDEHAGHGGHLSDLSAVTFKMRDSTDLLYPCTAVGTRYQPACYSLQGGIILGWVNSDFGRAATACDGAPTEVRHMCYQSLGTVASGMTVRDTRKTLRLCSLGDPAYQPWCFLGTVKNFVDVSGDPDDGLRFCERVPTGESRRLCYVSVGEQIMLKHATDREAREAACGRARIDGRLECRFGARLLADTPPGLPILPPGLRARPS